MSDTMTVGESQADLRRAYAGAGPGQLIVGAVWIAAGLVLARGTLATSFAVLFLGSFFIYPGALLVSRVILRRPSEAKGNRLVPVVPEGLPILVSLLFAAWLLIPYRPDVVMPLAAIATGTHYLPFQTAYGLKAFWVLGAIIALLGFAAIFGPLPSDAGLMLLVGGIVAAFGGYLTIRDRVT